MEIQTGVFCVCAAPFDFVLPCRIVKKKSFMFVGKLRLAETGLYWRSEGKISGPHMVVFLFCFHAPFLSKTPELLLNVIHAVDALKAQYVLFSHFLHQNNNKRQEFDGVHCFHFYTFSLFI